MENAPGDEQDAVPALLFRVRSRLCALPITHVIETMRPLPIEQLAGAPVAVKGMALIRGAPIPVVALVALFDDGDDDWDDDRDDDCAECPARFITVRTGKEQIALTVDAVLGVHRIADVSLRNLPPLLQDADNNVVSAIGTADAELLLVLNAARLVPEGLWSALNTAEARAGARTGARL